MCMNMIQAKAPIHQYKYKATPTHNKTHTLKTKLAYRYRYMEQVGEGRGGGELRGDENKQCHPRPPPQQQCPRCESLDTKFCYYNNYSLLQPRYFCKACKRSWTQGGTLRNIPIGGHSRRGKRSKSSSSSTINSFQSPMQLHPQPQPQLQVQPQTQLQLRPQPTTQEVVQNQPNLTTQPQLRVQPQMQMQQRPQPAIQEVVQNQTKLTTFMRHTPPITVQSTSPYYQGSGVGGGGYLSSQVEVRSLNPSPQPFNQSLNVGVGDVVASSNSGLLSGFNTAASLGSQHNHRSQICPPQFNQIGQR